MATLQADSAGNQAPKQFVTRIRIVSLVILVALLTLCLVLAWTTRNAMSLAPAPNQAAKPNPSNALVQAWQTTIDLASMAVTAEEHRYARTAETLADHEVHQAFQAALNQAQLDVQKRSKEPEAKRLQQVVDQRQQTVTQDQSIIKSLQAKAADEPANDLDLVNAQLELDLDELRDAQQNLTRTLQDQRGELEQQLTAHEAAVKKYDLDNAAKSLGAVATSRNYGTLWQRATAWINQSTRYQAIQAAADQTDAATRGLSQQPVPTQNKAALASDDSAIRMDAMKRASMRKRLQIISSDRVDNLKHLSETYRKWAAQVMVQHQIVFHLLMTSCISVVLILLAGLLVDTAIRYAFEYQAALAARLGRNQESIRVLLRLLVHGAAALLLLLVLFGPPNQVTTAVGFATAGLTVVLQDFIISFCGWFVLMGKRGLRAGDWVEINGTAGEVAEIGIFRTALLETGNWTDLGHPTGRHITFPNSFAIRGEYFNFTTNGQWMWDELVVTVPPADAYGSIELILKAVLEETKTDSELAEAEWQSAGRGTGLSKISALATVNMRPSGADIDIIIRYVTRASTRSRVRNLLYVRVLEVIHKPVAV